MKPHQIASLVLVGTCALWAFSFPILKSLQMVGQARVPSASSFFLSTLLVAIRFSLAAVLFGPWILRRRPSIGGGSPSGLVTRLELVQGGGIGLFGGLGLVLQMDGLAYTSGSVSAFLTQGYAVLIPIWVSISHRRLPSRASMGACVTVLIGAAILSGVSPDRLSLGRGEWETLAGSVLFAAQILWLERPAFRENRSLVATTLMFAVMAAVCWPLAIHLAPPSVEPWTPFSSGPALLLIGLLIGVCTVVTFPLANHWQPKVPAIQAGLLYCTEPVFTALVCLFLPSWLSKVAQIDYPDEQVDWRLLVGGGAILSANIWTQLTPNQTFPESPAEAR